jgi:hypothetical protein
LRNVQVLGVTLGPEHSALLQTRHSRHDFAEPRRRHPMRASILHIGVRLIFDKKEDALGAGPGAQLLRAQILEQSGSLT